MTYVMKINKIDPELELSNRSVIDRLKYPESSNDINANDNPTIPGAMLMLPNISADAAPIRLRIIMASKVHCGPHARQMTQPIIENNPAIESVIKQSSKNKDQRSLQSMSKVRQYAHAMPHQAETLSTLLNIESVRIIATHSV